MSNYWTKQTTKEPLYPDLIWSRPSNKLTAGKLLVVGGNSGGFKDLANAYATAEKAGAGVVKVLMPDALQKTIGKVLEMSEFASSTPSGSFDSKSLATILDHAQWSDGVLLAGDFGQNSETASMIENMAGKYNDQLTFSGDAVDIVISNPLIVLNRPNTLIVLEFRQLQKLFMNSRFTRSITSTMSLDAYVEALHEFTKRHQPTLMTVFNGNIVIANNGQLTSTRIDQEIDLQQIGTTACVWWLQNPSKTIEAITSSLVSNNQ